MSKKVRILIFFVTVGLGFYLLLPFSSTIEYVEDGDTFRTSSGEWIRLARIDAPEVGQEGYFKAKSALKAYEGASIQLDCPEVGYYDRKICEVYYQGRNLSDKLLKLPFVEKYE